MFTSSTRILALKSGNTIMHCLDLCYFNKQKRRNSILNQFLNVFFFRFYIKKTKQVSLVYNNIKVTEYLRNKNFS